MYKYLLKFANGIEFIAVVLELPSVLLSDTSAILRHIANKNNSDKQDENDL